MKKDAKCPNCGEIFLIKGHLKYGFNSSRSFKNWFNAQFYPWFNDFEGMYKPNLVVCPECSNEFTPRKYKYFGFLDLWHFQTVFMFIFILILFIFLGGTIWSLLRGDF